jgi:inorganic triphosphatase YgiF
VTGTGVGRAEEIERKYDVPEGIALPDAGALLGSPADIAAEHRGLDAVYFDTADLRLLRAGVTLRRRAGGEDAGWHLKLPSGQDTREELRLPLGSGGPHPPAELAALVRVHSRDAALVPVAELRTERRAWTRRDGGGATLAELVEDSVTAIVPGADTPRAWREVEVELGAAGDVALLDEIEARLARAGLRRATSSSKLGRVLAARPPADAPDVEGRRADAGAVLVGYLRAHVGELRRLDPLVRRDVPDAVHRMRVEARRLRSALQAFGAIIDRGRTRALVEDLAWVAGELGPARDTEVLAARLAELGAELPGDLAGPVRDALARTFDTRAADARRRALAALDAPRHMVLQGRIDELLADPPLTAAARRRANREITRGVVRAHRRFDRRMDDAEQVRDAAARDLALHEARKAAKRLRYAVEVATPVLGRPATRLRRRLAAVQDLLGERQDTVVSREVLRRLADGVDGPTGFGYGLLHAAEAARARRAERAVPETRRKLRPLAGRLG